MHNLDLPSALADAEARYTAANPNSAERHRRAAKGLPGGSTRAVLFYEPFPIAMVRGEGCRLFDLDGHAYIDFVSEYGAGLFGHSDPVIHEAMRNALAHGWALGAPNPYEADLALELVRRFPAFERVRFCNSGTEANILALATARAVTGRGKVMVFRDGYHGGVLTFAGGGSPLNVPYDYVHADYNETDATVALIRQHAADLACVIVEPMLGGGGCIPADRDFLLALRHATREAGALLILDEVITSRLGPQGLHGELGLDADLVTMGKYLGGGSSFGVFGGGADIMDRFDPLSPNAFGHGGTFNNNVLSMSGGLAGLTQVLTPEASRAMNALGDRMRAGMNKTAARQGIELTVTGLGSMMNVHFVAGPITRPKQLAARDKRLNRLMQLEMLLRGFHITPRGMLALSLPHGEPEIATFLEAFEDFLGTHRAVLPRAVAREAAE